MTEFLTAITISLFFDVQIIIGKFRDKMKIEDVIQLWQKYCIHYRLNEVMDFYWTHRCTYSRCQWFSGGECEQRNNKYQLVNWPKHNPNTDLKEKVGWLFKNYLASEHRKPRFFGKKRKDHKLLFRFCYYMTCFIPTAN